jgi:hypothetical protein
VLTLRCAVQSFCSMSWAEAYAKLATDRLSQAARYLDTTDQQSSADADGRSHSWSTAASSAHAAPPSARLYSSCSIAFARLRTVSPTAPKVAVSECRNCAPVEKFGVHGHASKRMWRRRSYVTPRSAGRSDKGTGQRRASVVAIVLHL